MAIGLVLCLVKLNEVDALSLCVWSTCEAIAKPCQGDVFLILGISGFGVELWKVNAT